MDYTVDAIALLEQLIATPSSSRKEHATADLIAGWLEARGVATIRLGNNVVAEHRSSNPDAPVLLLNSHHDTVLPGGGWSTDPYVAAWNDDVLYGLGSNDAGGALVMMLATFMHLRAMGELDHHLVFAATAEEEVSGSDGMALLTREYFGSAHYGMPIPSLALVGEPTGMQLAVAERGLIVLDCVAHGRTGHAARNEGVNAIYAAMEDVAWCRGFVFERTSPMLGSVTMTVTQIQAGRQHNVVPDTCSFVVDVRTTDQYTNEDVLTCIQEHMKSTVTPRSMRLQPSSIPLDHPFVRCGIELGLTVYGSPTLSDQSLLPHGVPSLKIGPGDSARSHTPNEFITRSELVHGIALLTQLVERYVR